MGDTLKVFTSYDIQACLHDVDRAELFRQAINRTVRPKDVVVDAGSGSGLLGLLAARAGAGKVYCIETNDEYIDVIQANARHNGLDDVIIAVHDDATTYQLPEQVDIILSEVISAGLFYEPQLQIMNNLLPQLKRGGRVIPQGLDNRVELISAQASLYGLTFVHDSRYHALPEDRALTESRSYLRTDLRKQSKTNIEAEVRLTATADGTANAMRIGYSVEFTAGDWAHTPTSFLMNPQIVFLSTPVAIEQGKEYMVRLAYEASGSPLRAILSVERATKR